MIKGKMQGKKIIMICGCGNSNQDTIFNYIKTAFTVDSKLRKKLIKLKAFRCNVCGTVSLHSEVMQEIRDLLASGQTKPESVN